LIVFDHVPVLLDQVVEALQPADGEVFVDCTLGGGGHAAALLAAADCSVMGIDRDPAALEAATLRCAFAGDRFRAVRGQFSSLQDLLTEAGHDRVDGILADVGVSSHQLDTASRGFSFRHGGPIDMRMDPQAALCAATLVNTWTETELAEVIRRYGEERHARRVARAIVDGRPWSDTAELGAAIARVLGRGKGRIHPATRTFQGLRIAVNDELQELESLLAASVHALKAHGRLAIITFHSLEDRIVKQFLATQAGKNLPRDPYGNRIGPVHFSLSKPVTPADSDPNPRARSARLRAARRLPWN